MTQALAEEDEPEDSTMTTKASIEEAEDTTRLSKNLRWINVYDNGGANVFTGSPRSQRQQLRRQLRKHKIQRVWVNVSNGGGTSVFMGRGYWLQQRRRRKSKTVQRTQWRWRRRWQRTRDTWRVRGIGDNNGGGGGETTGLGNTRQQRRHRRRKISTKTTTTTTDALAEDWRRVQGIEDNNRGGSRLTTVLVDWQWQWSVDFTCFQVAISNTVLPLSSCCLVLILFSSDSFFPRSLHEILSVLQSCGKYFCTKCTPTLRMYPLRTGE